MNTKTLKMIEFPIVGGDTTQLHVPVEKVPQPYQRLAYVGSKNDAYIDTGVYMNKDISFELICEYNSGNFLFGADGDDSGKRNSFGVNVYNNSDTWRIHYGNQQYQNLGTVVKDTIVKFKYDKNRFYINDELIYTFNVENFHGNYPVILGGINRGGTVQNFANIKIYSCKIWDGDILVRWYVPARSNNTRELYDIINNIWNRTPNGNFEPGNDVY